MPAQSEVIAVIDEAMRVTAARDRADLTARLTETRERLGDDRVRILVIGEFKQGKSQLVNALVQAPVCPVDDDIATSVPTAVRWAEQPAVTLVRTSEDPERRTAEPGADAEDPLAVARRVSRTDVPLDSLARYVSEAGNPGNLQKITYAEVGIPRQMLAGGLELVDTPGVGGLRSVRATATLAAIPSADAVLMVSDAAQEYTGAELDFLARAVKLCPNVTCVLTKTDIFPEWRRIAELDRAHLAKAEIDAELLPVSSALRLQAVTARDAELNTESGFPRLVDLLADRVRDAERLSRRSVATAVQGVCEQLAASLHAELGVQENPETREATVAALTAAKDRAAALRDRSARWQQTLADGGADLIADIEHDLRERMRDIMRDAEEEIELLGDPKVIWEEFAPWVTERVAQATADNFVWTSERAQALAQQVAEHFAEDGAAALPELAAKTGSGRLAEVREMYLTEGEKFGFSEKALSGLRGGYIGALMFGMLGTLAGLALLNPFSVGAGVLLGGKTIREEKRRILQRRQAEAKATVRRYTDDVIFQVGKDCRDMLRSLQRQLRDHFTAQAKEMETSLQESVRSAEATAKTSAAERDRRIKELKNGLAAIQDLRARATALSGTVQVDRKARAAAQR